MEQYRDAGVDYDALDAVKRAALAAASVTTNLPLARGGRPVEASRGESAYVLEIGGMHLGVVLECLGTKSRIAREFQERSGADRFQAVGWDTVAAAVNDLAAVGVLPLVVNAYFAVGSARWFEVPGRAMSLIQGFRAGCEESGAAWGGGETPVLNGILHDDEIDLAAAAIGASPRGHAPILGSRLQAGDEIVLVESSGLHTNGASLARAVAEDSEHGWLAVLADGRLFGESVLDPSMMYVRLMAELLGPSLPVTYAVHVTGHGLRKLMRAKAGFTYRIRQLPEAPLVLRYLVEASGMDDYAAYGTLNMGVGFAVLCEQGTGASAAELANRSGYRAFVAGEVEEGPRRVILDPLGVEYSSEELQMR